MLTSLLVQNLKQRTCVLSKNKRNDSIRKNVLKNDLRETKQSYHNKIKQCTSIGFAAKLYKMGGVMSVQNVPANTAGTEEPSSSQGVEQEARKKTSRPTNVAGPRTEEPSSSQVVEKDDRKKTSRPANTAGLRTEEPSSSKPLEKEDKKKTSRPSKTAGPRNEEPSSSQLVEKGDITKTSGPAKTAGPRIEEPSSSQMVEKEDKKTTSESPLAKDEAKDGKQRVLGNLKQVWSLTHSLFLFSFCSNLLILLEGK